jgi:glycosyltransferase involved in cell wall biosynthesis
MSGGMAKHIRSTTRRLAAAAGDIRLFAPKALGDEMTREGWPVETWTPADALGGRRALRRAVERFGADVVFVPTARWVDCGGTATVVMVRNMEPLEVPFEGNPPLEKLRNIGRRFAARRAARKADRVIAVSQHVRDFLVSRWKIAEEKIGVVYHGLEPPPQARRPAALGALGDAPFVFAAGSIRPARGLEDVIAAMADPQLAHLHLVIAGQVVFARHKKKLDALARAAGVAGRLHWIGHVDAAEMSWCFRAAALFVMTSRAEACPNLVLEALSHGALSVSGDNAPMPEFFRDAARYYAVRDAVSLARVMNETLNLPENEKAALRAKALVRAGDFDWDRTADQTIAELQQAVRR